MDGWVGALVVRKAFFLAFFSQVSKLGVFNFGVFFAISKKRCFFKSRFFQKFLKKAFSHLAFFSTIFKKGVFIEGVFFGFFFLCLHLRGFVKDPKTRLFHAE